MELDKPSAVVDRNEIKAKPLIMVSLFVQKVSQHKKQLLKFLKYEAKTLR